jgi:tetratricopeptide (TPR) repeat protein
MDRHGATPRSAHPLTATLQRCGISAFQGGRTNVALGLMAQACARPDASALCHRDYAEILRQCGRRADAEAAARRAVALDPNCAEAWQTLGTLLFASKALAESRDCFATAVRISPSFVDALNNLAVVLQLLGERGAAEVCYTEVLRLAPDNSDIKLNFAALKGELGRHRDGLAIVEEVLDQTPNLVRAHLIASEIERDLGRHAASLIRVERAATLAPAQIEIVARRAHLMCALSRWDAALCDCDRAARTAPHDPDVLHARALALQGLNRPTEALEAFRAAEAASPAPAPIVTDRGWLLAELGRGDEARAELDRALKLDPGFDKALYCRASLTSYAADHPDLATMAAIVDNPDSPYQARLALSFALGKAYLDMGDGERAFARLREGNRLQRAIIDYNPDADERCFAETTAVFSADILSRLAGRGLPSTRPIFVFGMPRSGTTMLEQMLAAHPLVHGAGEPRHLSEVAEAPGLPAAVRDLAPGAFAAMGRRYLDLVGAGVPDELRIVDKMPLNFRHAGLISLILPRARMIHCRRNPLDTCLSCYSLRFASGQEFSYDLGELGRFYRLYDTLMAHWRHVLPPDSFLDVEYEALVTDTENELRKALDFCRLPWDARCLRFHETGRRVTSASLVQVRSAVYTKSVGRAQRFRSWLSELEVTLGDLAVYPSKNE